ncbi:MAG: MarR family transcriptional regulator [Ilumatobacteraceae bacterium]|nr:MarR family transcriptional regulator [Ilumatobacteraceae bacterium]
MHKMVADATIFEFLYISCMATNWISTAEMMAWRSFITTTGDLLRAIERELEPFDLDMGDYQLLVMLSEAPEKQLRMSDLADALRLTRGGLTRRMEGVVKKKLVSRVQSSEDGRVAFAQMTAKGVATLNAVAPEHVETVRRLMIDLLTPAEVKAVGTAFSKIRKNLAKELK